MKYSTTFRETDVEIQVRRLEAGEVLSATAAVITHEAKKMLGLSSRSRLRLVNLYRRPSKLEVKIEGYAVKVVEPTQQRSCATTEEVLYVAGNDFEALANATNSQLSSENAYEGFRLEMMPDKPNMFCLSFISNWSQEDQLQAADYLSGVAAHAAEYAAQVDGLAALIRKNASVSSETAETTVDREVGAEEIPCSVEKCFVDAVKSNIEFKRMLQDLVSDNDVNASFLALLEQALFELGFLKGIGVEHTLFVDALTDWGIIKNSPKISQNIANMSTVSKHLNSSDSNHWRLTKRYKKLRDQLDDLLSRYSIRP